ncbi:MAG: 50S ribosomal protein L25 [Candidatus Zixiibacteriota bacterium]|jgi:large subunit ribosomal protein L25
MKEVAISATARQNRGKGPARRARRDGRIPAVVYGPEIKPMSLEIDEKDLRVALKAARGGGASIFNLDVNGQQNKVVMREIQRDPVTSKVVHVDFHAISMNKPIHISLPIHFKGLPRGVKTDGGIMQTTLREIAVSCLPSDIPDDVVVDVSDLGIGDSVHVEDIEIPNVRVLEEGDRTVVVISAPTVVKAAAVAAEGEEAEEAVAEGEEAAEGEAEKKEEGEEEKKEKKEEK